MMSATSLCCLLSVILLYVVSVRADCASPPPSIENTTQKLTESPPFPEGTVVRLTCYDGYMLETNTLLYTCSNSQWSVEGEIECSQIFCGHVETPDGGYVLTSPTYEVGSFLKFDCLEGYEKTGTGSLFCRLDGEWNPSSAPTCTVRDCGEFGKVLNGETFQDNTYVEKNKFGSIIKVICDSGYVLNGTPELKCQSNGQWEPTSSCLQTSCEAYPGLKDSRCVQNYRYTNNLLFMVCQNDDNISGTKVGPSNASCTDNAWDSTDMACLCNCKIPTFNSNIVEMRNLNEKGFLPHGEVLDWSCLGGAAEAVTDGTSVVCEHGDLKVCAPNVADIVLNANNQTVKDSDLCVTEDEVEDPEDEVEDSGDIPDEVEDPADIPDCASPPPSIEHTTQNPTESPPFPEGSVVRLTCNDGYMLETNTLLFTCSNSQWSVEGEIECSQIFCGHVETPDGGYVVTSPTYEVGSFLKFDCHEGYAKTGTSSLFCRLDGEWNPRSAPTCTVRDCGEFGDVLNGKTFQDNTYVEKNKFGSIVEVTCDSGYVLNGKPELKCQSNGQWEPTSSCLQTSCEAYPGLNDSRCVQNYRYTNNLLFMVCQDDDNISGTKVGPLYTRCTDNVWDSTDMACLCNCKIPTFNSNIVEMRNLNKKGFLPHGEVLDWSCLGGAAEAVTDGTSVVCEHGELKVRAPNVADIVLNANNQTVKDSDLCVTEDEVEDSGDIPDEVEDPVDIPDCASLPPSIENTTQNLTESPPFPEGSVVRLTCNDGYMLETNTLLYTCLNSQWSVEGEIECSQIFCGHVETPDGGYVVTSPTYEVGSFFEFDCLEGYEKTGTSSLFCRLDGEWNPSSAPTCTVRDCGEFGEVLNGKTFQYNTYVERNKFGSIVEVTCDSGYVLNGKPELKCQSNGQWEPTPSCLQTSCEAYPGVNDSRCVQNYRYTNNLLFMVCQDDDNISGTKVGPSNASCTDNAWDSTDMACLCNCKIPTFNSNIVEMRNLNEKGFLPHGEVLDWSCLGGAAEAVTDGTSVVCEHGHLKVRAPNVADIVLNANNQTVKDSDLCVTEDEVEDPEDEVEDSGDIPDEVEDPVDIPDCASLPPSIENTTQNLTEGSVVRLTCNDGYMLETNTLLYTCSNSQWSVEGEIKCSQIFCGHVETPDGGYVVASPTYEVGSFLKFDCHEGYDKTGTSSLFCRLDGEWNPSSAPTCTVRDCGEFGEVLNGETFQYNTYVERNKFGSIVEVTCDSGYVLNGKPELKCQSNGQWEPTPSCLQTSCEAYPGFNDSRCVQNYRYTNNLLFMVCQDDDNISGTKVGPSNASCTDNAWDSTDMACLCNCKIPTFNSNIVEMRNLNEKGFLPHGEVLDWSCLGGAAEAVTDGTSVVCEHGHLKVRAPNVADIVLNANNQTVKDSDLCVTEDEVEDPEDEVEDSGDIPDEVEDPVDIPDCASLPPSIENTTQNLTESPPFTEGSVVRLTCNDGYMLETNTLLYTCSNSQWSVEGEIECSQIFCGHVETPDGGYVVASPTYEVGSSLKFDCHEGYDKTGTSSLFCRLDGEWNPSSAPTCTVRDCGEFGEVLNGETFQYNTYVERNKFGSIVEVTCDSGYVLNGKPELKCQSNGQWEPTPSCLQTSCEAYPGFNDSRCVQNYRYTNNLLFMVCQDDDNISGTKVGPSNASCTDNAWDSTDMACLCNCKIPTFNSNIVEMRNLNEKGFLPLGEVLDWSCLGGAAEAVTDDTSVVCEHGHLMVRAPNVADIVLNANNQTVKDSDLCVTEDEVEDPEDEVEDSGDIPDEVEDPVDIPDCASLPPSIENTTQNLTESPPFPEGSVVRLTCNDGYMLETNTLLYTCSNSQWSVEGEIKCSQIFCGHVETPDGGYVVTSPTYEVGSFLKFDCHEGYDKTGTSSLFCRPDGEWNPSSAPTCTVRDCGEFGDVLNGKTFQDNTYVEKNKFGSIVEVTCDSGYVLNGKPELKCQSNGQWEPTSSCLQTSCEAYPGLNDSRCVQNYRYTNNLLFMVCQDDDNISGTKVGPLYTRCTDNVWDSTDMACLCNCKIPTFNSNIVEMRNLNEKGFLPHGEVLDWSCLGGAAEAVTDGTSVVCEHGQLKVRAPNVADIVLNANTQTVKDSDLCVTEDEVEDPEDEVEDSGDIPDEVEDPVDIPDCASLPPSIENTTQNLTESPPFPEGSVVRLTCNDGYMLETNTLLYTCLNSQWSVEGEIECSQIFCGHVETPDGGYVVTSPTYEVGSSLKFDCHEGYDKTGTSSLFCRLDGEWNPSSAPTCTVRDCGEFGEVLNGKTFQYNTYVERNKFGSIVEVTCDSGYVLNGKPELKCQSNGQWEPTPSCLQTSCEAYPGFNDSRCVQNYRYTNNLLFMVCQNDDNISGTKVGPSNASCTDNAWDSTDMACLCNCKIPTFNSNIVEMRNLNEKGFLPHGEVLDWSCLGGAAEAVTDGTSVVCEHGHLKVRAPNVADIVLNANNQTVKDSDLCVTEDEVENPEDKVKDPDDEVEDPKYKVEDSADIPDEVEDPADIPDEVENPADIPDEGTRVDVKKNLENSGRFIHVNILVLLVSVVTYTVIMS